VRVLLEEMNVYTSNYSPQCGWAPSNLVEDRSRRKKSGRRANFFLCLSWNIHLLLSDIGTIASWVSDSNQDLCYLSSLGSQALGLGLEPLPFLISVFQKTNHGVSGLCNHTRQSFMMNLLVCIYVQSMGSVSLENPGL
jgi:hypothetical protein